jgi:signal transduction histidine kinase
VALVHKEVDRLRGTASRKLVTMSIDSLRKRVEVTAHEGELRLAVKELLVNAIKFNRAEGHVSVVVKCDAEWAAIRISDTGSGMPKDFVAKAGLAFAQAQGGLARKQDGVGLGLALVSAIAQSNNGLLRLDSQEGRGSTATLALKRGLVAAATAAA